MTKHNPTLFDNLKTGKETDADVGHKLLELLPGRLEKELLRFLEAEHGMMLSEEKLAVILTVQFRMAGHVCLPTDKSLRELGQLVDLESAVINLLPARALNKMNTAIIDEPEKGTPFVWDGDKLYQRRYYKMEQDLKEWIDQKSESQAKELSEKGRAILNDLFDEKDKSIGEPDWQKVAVVLSAFNPFLIISGGPGTGKTTTVARLLVLHQRSSEKPLRIALAAPTGKAAGRMGEALKEGMKRLNLTEKELAGYPAESQTIHRLLRGVEERGLLPPVREKKLPYDMVIVDEASMVDLSLMNRLIRHLAPETNLVLLGDKNQLASVEAGSVFADLCGKTDNEFRGETIKLLEMSGVHLPENKFAGELTSAQDSIVYLTKSYRFSSGSGIGTLAESVKKGMKTVEEADHLFDGFDDIHYRPFEYQKEDFEVMMQSISERVKQASRIDDIQKMLDFWKQQIWLTVVRRGLSGSDRLNRLAEQSLATKRTVRMKQGWYNGRPIIITRNDYDLGVYNGDFGVCMMSDDEDRRYLVHVQSGAEIKTIRPERLQDFNPAFFLTVHKSQGSEFYTINLLMPKEDVPVLSKELLYTAITRAKKQFVLYGSKSLFVKGSRRRTERFSRIS